MAPAEAQIRTTLKEYGFDADLADDLTAEQIAWLLVYAKSLSKLQACARAGISRTCLYGWARNSPRFAEALEHVKWVRVKRLEYAAHAKAGAFGGAVEDIEGAMVRWLLPRLDYDKYGDPEKKRERELDLQIARDELPEKDVIEVTDDPVQQEEQRE